MAGWNLFLTGWSLFWAGWIFVLAGWSLFLASCSLFLAGWSLSLTGWSPFSLRPQTSAPDLAPHSSHLTARTAYTSHLTAQTSHLTPQTSGLLHSLLPGPKKAGAHMYICSHAYVTHCPTCMYYRSVPMPLEMQPSIFQSTVRSGDCDNQPPTPHEISNTNHVISLVISEVVIS